MLQKRSAEMCKEYTHVLELAFANEFGHPVRVLTCVGGQLTALAFQNPDDPANDWFCDVCGAKVT